MTNNHHRLYLDLKEFEIIIIGVINNFIIIFLIILIFLKNYYYLPNSLTKNSKTYTPNKNNCPKNDSNYSLSIISSLNHFPLKQSIPPQNFLIHFFNFNMLLIHPINRTLDLWLSDTTFLDLKR
jgi:hypothetical protein